MEELRFELASSRTQSENHATKQLDPVHGVELRESLVVESWIDFSSTLVRFRLMSVGERRDIDLLFRVLSLSFSVLFHHNHPIINAFNNLLNFSCGHSAFSS